MSLQVKLQGRRSGFSFTASLQAQPGRITALFGPSGCGKTSLLRAIAGLDSIESGQVLCGGETWHDDAVCVPAHRRHAALVFQRPPLFSHLNVQGNLALAQRYRRPGDAIELDELVQVFDLTDLMHRRTSNLSGGEAQRVSLVRALVSNPRVLLLDEPLAGLDRWRKQEILPYLCRLKSRVDIPMLYVSHSLDELAALADELVLMQMGQTGQQGGLAQMLRQQSLLQNMQGEEFSLLDAQSFRRDEARHLLLLEAAGVEFRLPLPAAPVGEGLRLQVRSRDVSICLDRPQQTSILNILPAKVSAIHPEPEVGQCLVELQIGSELLYSRISQWSGEQLKLQVGMQVYAQVKAASLARS